MRSYYEPTLAKVALAAVASFVPAKGAIADPMLALCATTDLHPALMRDFLQREIAGGRSHEPDHCHYD
jgi:hypothetical protein